MKTLKSIATGLIIGAALIIIATLAACSMAVGPDGKPVFGVDPVALTQTIQLWQQKNGGSKYASVVIVDQNGKAITAASVSPSGTVTPTVIPPSLANSAANLTNPVVLAQSIQEVQKNSPNKEANVIVVDSAGRGVSSINVSPKGVVTAEAFSQIGRAHV